MKITKKHLDALEEVFDHYGMDLDMAELARFGELTEDEPIKVMKDLIEGLKEDFKQETENA